MPKAFSEREKEIIQERLLTAGEQLFQTYGLRKTCVEDLARAAAVSKGAFYLFYESKEALFVDILDQYEVEFRQRLIKSIHRPGKSSRKNFRAMLQEALEFWHHHPLLRQLDQEDIQYLARKLPQSTFQRHFQDGGASFDSVAEQWRAAGADVQADPQLIGDLIKALYFVSLHEEDFGPGYQRTLDVLTKLISGYLFEN